MFFYVLFAHADHVRDLYVLLLFLQCAVLYG